MSITFYSKAEALEYVRQKHDDGFISKLEHMGGSKYAVSIVGTVEKYESGAKGLFKNDEITLPAHTSTRTRLHELGHKHYGHKGGMLKISELARHEIEAESYAYEKMGKPLSYKVAMPAFVTLVEDFGETPDEALETITGELKKKDISISKEEQQRLMEFVEE